MKKYNIDLTNLAKSQLISIKHYIENELNTPQTANKLIDSIENSILSLETFPDRYPIISESPWNGEGVRKFVVKNYIIYYKVFDKLQKVIILAIVNEKKDQKNELLKI